MGFAYFTKETVGLPFGYQVDHIPLTKLICSTNKITKNGIHIQKELRKWFLKFIFFLWKGLVVLFVFNEEIAFKSTLMQI